MNNPFLADSLLLNQGGQRRISKIGPSYMYNTIDNPIFPTTGRKLSLSMDVAGLGGNSKFYSGKTEGDPLQVAHAQDLDRPARGRTSSSIRTARTGSNLPIFEKLFLGGEYSIRGFDIRSVGPRDLASGLVIGGNKSLLFNAEYLISLPARSAWSCSPTPGQVRDYGEKLRVEGTDQALTTINGLPPADAADLALRGRRVHQRPATRIDTVGETPRVQDVDRRGDPVLHAGPERAVPADFRDESVARQRAGQQSAPGEEFKFRFAVGTTF